MSEFVVNCSRTPYSQMPPQSRAAVLVRTMPTRSINAGPNGELHYSLWSVKVHGTWEAPAGFVVTPSLMHESG